MISLPVAMQTSAGSPCSHWNLGSLSVSFGYHGRCIPPRQGADLLIPTCGVLRLHHGTEQPMLRPPHDLLYLPARAHPLHTSPFHGWRLSLDPVRLAQLSAELTQHRCSPARFQARLQNGSPLQIRQSPQRELGEALLQMLQLSASQPLQQEQQLELVGLDRTIQRIVVLLLCGDLIQAARERQQMQRGSKIQIFEELLVWIEANLHRQIQLVDLVEQSGYSQRSLRNFFQERFGCGPIHWIRNRRLQAARQRLLSPQPQDSVSAIAASFGYPHLSQFSRDFHKTYNVRPSELLREGLRALKAT